MSDMWEKWGRRIWGKGALGIKKNRIRFLTCGRTGVATYRKKVVLANCIHLTEELVQGHHVLDVVHVEQVEGEHVP